MTAAERMREALRTGYWPTGLPLTVKDREVIAHNLARDAGEMPKLVEIPGRVNPLREVADRPVARRTDPSTSWEAARSVSDLTAKQAEVLALVRHYGPMTDEDIAGRYRLDIDFLVRKERQSPSGLRTRRSELVKAGLLRDTGQRKVGSTGRNMIVWEAA